MKRKILSLMLAAALVLGLTIPTLAAGQTFSDVPSSYWGYADIEAVAEAGLMNGTGNGAFSPEMKVSVAQFLTLLGRLVFPDVKAEGADWFGPYVTAAQEAKLLDGTQVDTNNVEAEISRYDMAVILRAAAKKLGVAEKAAQSSEVKDYLDIPTRYADSVLAVYGMGLIKGDQAGNFNGSNTMMRAEVATVIMRLAKAKPGGTTTESDPEMPEQPEKPVEPEMVHVSLVVWPNYPVPYSESSHGYVSVEPSVPMRVLYTEDNGKTYDVIGEGFSQKRIPNVPAGRDDATIEFDIDKNLVNAGNGVFYLSGEIDLDGVHYATQDLRTDGRATVIPLDMKYVLEGYRICTVQMVPAATGYKRTVRIEGVYGVPKGTEGIAQCRYYPDGDTGFGTGILLGEAPLVQDEYSLGYGVLYKIEFEMDTLDYAKDDLAAYRIELYKSDGTLLNSGSTLSTLMTVGTSRRVVVE